MVRRLPPFVRQENKLVLVINGIQWHFLKFKNKNVAFCIGVLAAIETITIYSLNFAHYQNLNYTKYSSDRTSIVFLTGSSANHMETLILDLFPSIEKFVMNPPLEKFESQQPGAIDFHTADIKVIHYNLDPIEKRKLESNQAQYKKLHDQFPFVEMRDFEYAAYPSFCQY